MIDHSGKTTPRTLPDDQSMELVQSGLKSLDGPAIEGRPAQTAASPALAADKSAPQPLQWWKPSFADVFLVALLLWTFASNPSGWSALLLDGDSGWHIRTGEYVLDNGKVPFVDLFSFSKGGQQWFAWEWLSDVIWASLHRAMGLKGVAWLGGALIAAYAGIVLRFCFAKGANSFIGVAITLLTVGAASIHYHARPHLTTLVLVPVFAWILDSERTRPTFKAWLLIPLMAAWTNLHGGFMVGIILAGAAAVGTAAEVLLGRPGADWKSVRRFGLITAGLIAATFVNPYTYQLHVHVAKYLSSDWIRSVVDEFRSPDFRGEAMLQFEALLILGMVCVASFVRQKRIVEVLWLLGFAHMALGSARHVTIFVSVAAPWIAAEISGWWNQYASRQEKKSVAGILDAVSRDARSAFARNSIWAPALILILLALDKPLMNWPSNFPAERFPVALAEKYQDRIRAGRTLTTDQWGDYLIYRHYPNQKVFVDGRSDFFGPEVGNEYLAILQAQHNWSELMDKYGFTFAVVPVEWPVTSLLKKEASWRVLADDGKAVVLEKRTLNGVQSK